MTHDELGETVRDKLKSRGYEVAFSNMIDAGVGEQPDCLGIDIYGNTILIESKVSRSDFNADKKKPWRKEGKGIGKQRVYVTPVGLLKPEEIPFGWQLWEIKDDKRKTLKVIKGKVVRKYKDESVSIWPITETTYPNTSEGEMSYFSKTNDSIIINVMLIKILRRIKSSGVDIDSFSKGSQLYNK